MLKLTAAAALVLISLTTAADAYIGPGAGAGTIAAVLGVLASIAMAVVAIVWYPVKRLYRKRKSVKAKTR